VGGNDWVEGMYSQPFNKAQDQLGYRTQLRVTLDARTNTEYGLLRTVVDPRFNKRNGNENSASQNREGNSVNGTNADGTAKQFQVNTTAYIQLGGLTVGRLGSFANAQFGSSYLDGPVGVDARDEVTTVAYTASLGHGITINLYFAKLLGKLDTMMERMERNGFCDWGSPSLNLGFILLILWR